MARTTSGRWQYPAGEKIGCIDEGSSSEQGYVLLLLGKSWGNEIEMEEMAIRNYTGPVESESEEEEAQDNRSNREAAARTEEGAEEKEGSLKEKQAQLGGGGEGSSDSSGSGRSKSKSEESSSDSLVPPLKKIFQKNPGGGAALSRRCIRRGVHGGHLRRTKVKDVPAGAEAELGSEVKSLSRDKFIGSLSRLVQGRTSSRTDRYNVGSSTESTGNRDGHATRMGDGPLCGSMQARHSPVGNAIRDGWKRHE